MKLIRYYFLLIFILIGSLLYGGTTGKIAGRVTDAQSGDPLPFANVLIENTTMGAAADMNGNYVILRVPPGVYTLRATMVGYQTQRFENVRVSIDLTTTINFQMGSEVLAGQEVTVVAERAMVTKDLTATTAVMNSDEIAALPVTEVNEAIALQAGLVTDAGGGLHVRGGRSGEISYWIDGVPVTDVYDGGTVVEVNKDMVQELQVVSGAFNAEYGQAMSGIVNIATKSGSNDFGGNVTTYFGDNFSNHTRQFMNIDDFNPLEIRDFEGSLHGAIIKDKLFYFVNARHIYFDGWQDGQRRFRPHSVTMDLYDIPNQFMQLLAPEYMDSAVPGSQPGTSSFRYFLGTNEIIDSVLTVYNMPAEKLNHADPDSAAYYYNEYYNRLRSNHKDPRGDGKYVPMNWNRKLYTQGKIIFKPKPAFTLSYNFIYDNVDYQDYQRDYKYNPDGSLKHFRTGTTHIVKITHMVTSNTFYEIGLSHFTKNYKHYVYEDKFDPRYIHPDLSIQDPNSFKTGGTDNSWFHRRTQTSLAKFDLTSQVTTNHQVKAGVEMRLHDVKQRDITLRPDSTQTGLNYMFDSPFINPQVLSDETIYASRYHHKPVEFSAYIQDKMEFKQMIVNLGIRFDYFEPDGKVLADETDPSIYNPIRPENRYRDWGTDGKPNTHDPDGSEGNGIWEKDYEPAVTLADRLEYWYKDATPKYKFSPRIGVSFPITDRGVIHFSYGHFFQIPRFERLYQNPDFELGSGTGNVGIIGNADLKPEQTISGEIGLQQQLSDNISLNVTGYFRDIRDLTGTRADEIVLYGGFAKYSKLVNSDFGFIRGLIVALNKRFSGGFSASIDYTLQVAKGSNSDPEQARNAISGGALPEVQLTPLDWDQKHTVNATASYATQTWGASLIGQWGSGLPYTPRRSEDISTLLTNSQRKPVYYNVDLRAYKDLTFGPGTFTLFLRVFNLFDRLNEINVYDDTGRADFTLDELRARALNRPETVNSLDEWFTNATHFSEPRRVEFGLTYRF